MCFGKKDIPKPKIDHYTIDAGAISSEILHQGIETLFGRLDTNYYFTNLEDWGQVFNWIYQTQELPKSIPEISDCDDFAIWLKAMVSVHFGLNSCAFLIGLNPQGKHSFNMIKAEDGWYLWEPNPDFGIEEPFNILDEHGYKPEHILV